MKARWQALEARFAALQQREKVIVAAAGLIGVLVVGHDVWVSPASSRAAGLEKQIARDRLAVRTGQADIAALAARLKDRDAPNKAALAEVKRQMAQVDRELHEYEGILLRPEHVQEVLRSILARHRGLDLVSLQTLPAVPLVAPEPASPDARTADGQARTAADKSDSIHKQGIEIKLSGNYLDLLSYVSDLEHLPQKLLWGSMSLTVTTYPTTELTLTIYTLSPDSRWLVV